MKKVFFHSDLDGYTAGSIVKNIYKGEFYECTYDNRFDPKRCIRPGDEVIVLDYSFLPDDMLWCKKNCSSFIWVDHHVSAVNDSIKYGYNDVEGLRELGTSGAENAWMYFVSKSGLVPEYVNLVGDYDTFRSYGSKRFDEIVLPFFFGSEMYLSSMNPAKENYFNVFSSESTLKRITEKFIKFGKVIYQYKKSTCAKSNKESAFVRNIWGMTVLCLNTNETGSLSLTIPHEFNPSIHDMMLCYNYNGNGWSYGFYTNDHPEVDCSKIARLYGGGGHANAAGAFSKELLEELR